MGADTSLPVQGGDTGQLGLRVRRVPLDAPWDWLGRGWRDLCTVPHVSLNYGGVFALAAWVILFGLSLFGAVSSIPVLAGGFMLVGPLLAAGLYEASRRLEKGERITLREAMGAGWQAAPRLGFFGVVLFFAYFVWVELTLLLLMLFLGLHGATLPPPSEFLQTLLFTKAGMGLLVTGTLTGAVLAAIVFSISAVAAPLLFVKKVDVVTAMGTSMRAVRLNTGTMLLWAALVAGLMVLGLATLFLGLVVTFPLVGHATWHAFRGLVDLENN
jgi:uncharacterized membrane protein